MSLDTARRTRRGRIGPASAGIPLTTAEFDALPADAFVGHNRYELIHGVLVVSPPPGAGQRGPNDELGYMLRHYGETHPEGEHLDATLPEQTIYTAGNRRCADRAIWAGLGRRPDERDDLPAILVEFVSSRRRDVLRDYEHKRDEYLGAGVREYGVIDGFRRIMTVYRPGPCGPTYQIVTENDTYRTELLPGFELPLARLLAKADAWRRRCTPKPPAQGAD